MKKPAFIISLVFLVSCLAVAIFSSWSMTRRTSQVTPISRDFVPHELLVKLKEDRIGDLLQNRGLVQNVFNQLQGRIKTYLKEEKDILEWDPAVLKNRSFHADPYLFWIRVPEGIDLEYAIARLKLDPNVEYIEKNGLVRIDTDDPLFEEQWGLKNDTYSGRDIHAEDAWTISTGSSEVVVAVLDTGIDYNHIDFQGNMWTNPNEVSDGQDNDHNGFVDDLGGWNFYSGNNDYLDNNNEEYDYEEEQCVPQDIYHGTHVSGIIGAVANNEIGISGVCWNVKIMPLKTHDACGYASDADLINALDYATNNGAFLSSNSYSGDDENLSFKAAIARAQNKNRLFIAAAGNSSTGGKDIDIDKYKRYPVCYEYANIIGVLATENDDSRRNTSNYGSNSVDVGAPGADILSTKLGDGYQLHSGTSMATPFVAGTAALALGICPGLTSVRLKDLITDEADVVYNLIDKCVADGRLNAYKVLNAIEGSVSPTAPSNLIAYPKAWGLIEVRWNDNSNNEVGFEIQRKNEYQTAYLHHNSKDINSTSFAYFQDPIDTTQQRTYTYRVRTSNKAGISSFSNSYSATVHYTVPDAPIDLDGQSPTLEQNVNISWINQADNALYTFVERRIPDETDWEVIATLSYDDNAYSDNYALAGHTYEYRVRAGNPLGYSSYSNIISIEVIEW